jgi:hypothetical protein
MRVLILQLLSETFLVIRRIRRDIVKNVKRLHVNLLLFLSDWNEICNFSSDVRKKLKY